MLGAHPGTSRTGGERTFRRLISAPRKPLILLTPFCGAKILNFAQKLGRHCSGYTYQR
jgi:hypothetical protein